LLEVELTAVDNQDSVRGGMTALPNAAAAASGGLLINGTNTGTVSLAALTVVGQLAVQNGVSLTASTVNRAAFSAVGNGTGQAMVLVGGGNGGNGFESSAQAANADGFVVTGFGTGTGFRGNIVGNITGNHVGNVTGTIGSLAAQAKTDVNTEVVDALSTDTYAEPGQATPPATASISAKVGFLHKMARNQVTNDGTTIRVYNSGGSTIDQKSTVSETAGTVTRGEFATGP
jgi:hypothetical protein